MKNKIFLILIMACLFVTTVSASNGEIMAYLRNFNVQLNGEILDLRDSNGNKVIPVVINGTTYLPVRAISSSLGLNVDWNGDTQTIILSTKGKEIIDYNDDVDSDFKKTMDDYEAFIDNYVIYMNKYKSGELSFSDILKYAQILDKYNKVMSDLQNIDENSLSSSELNYYLETMNRINYKILDILN